MDFIKVPTRNLFFTGKGGVGKTSLASATAVHLADRGHRVLLVSTDPASNLDEVLGTPLGNDPTPVAAVPNLYGMNIDPEAAATAYRERMVGPYRGVLPDAAVKSMEEQFSGSCTVEIAAFDEFSKLLGDPSATAAFDHVIFDTAPTGHTLRLLTLPSAWSGFMETNTSGTSCLGPLAGLQAQQAIYRQTVAALSDASVTTLVLVARPESSAFSEAARTSAELRKLGVTNQHLVINGVFCSEEANDAVAMALQQRGEAAMAGMPAETQSLPQTIVPWSWSGLMGIEALRRIGQPTETDASADLQTAPIGTIPSGLGSLVDELAQAGHGVILAMGKGGVGKTTIASAVAVALAQRGLPVHLSTTDPAAHLAATMTADALPGLTVGRIDPAAETEAYKAEVLRTAGENLDPDGLALLEEDLRSPCTEEVAVFRAFAKAVAEGTDRFVVLDTAPTGHTVLLLDAAMAYHREVTRQTQQMPEAVQNLLPRLRDPQFTHVLLVTLPEATPVHEAATLQADLRRAQIEPFAWVINQSLVPLAVTDVSLRRRQQHELRFIHEVQSEHSQRLALVPWQIEPPTGVQGLARLTSANNPKLESPVSR
ncbi:Arsenical pump-driving ATPase [Rosistilla carotiformis]|uniref:arsenite-transporting ATPase n=1 Tax=Rosistilla carotiformis TaxID=2528017 RepID=A0A518JTJ9_9BACT|nr:arsenical pump-driving ATPase [Rosistilla carotiformis]QDV68870.1 Arsenical pump-driving ATPase [Rosistilla carotiformis]